jgi:hypothetical protein
MRIEFMDENTDETTKPSKEQSIDAIRLETSSNLAAARLEAQITPTEQPEKKITKKEIAKPKVEDAPEPLPDKALLSAEVAAFLRENRQAEPDPQSLEIARLREALDQLSQPTEELTFEQAMARKLESIESRLLQADAERAQQAAQARYENQIADFTSKARAYFDRNKEQYPGITKLGREDVAFQEYLKLANEDESASFEAVAQAMESQLRSDYETLHGIFDDQPSKATKPSKTPETKQASPQFKLSDYGSLQEAQQALWERKKAELAD